MLKKTISSLMTLLAALLLASCAPSHSTNNQTSASSTEVAKKNEISITISVTPEGQKAQSKTLKVAEESNLMKVLKANYKIEEKNGNPNFFCTNLCGHRKTCEPLRDCINKRSFYAVKDPSVVGIDDLF